MRPRANVPLVCLCGATLYAALALGAPKETRAAGLDFWNATREDEHLRHETAERDRLAAVGEALHRWNEAARCVAAGLGDGKFAPSEAVEDMMALLTGSPERLAQIRGSYLLHGLIAEGSTDRELAARYLRAKVVTLRDAAVYRGDPTRAATLASVLAQLDAEVGNEGRAVRATARPE